MRTASRPDLYRVLGVAAGAGADEINAAFRARAKELHPDVVHGDAERFKELSFAYVVLSDPARRRRYDHQRADVRPAGTPRPTPGPLGASAAAPVILGTPGRARAAQWGGLALVVLGVVLAVVVPFLGDATKGSTLGRDITLWIAAAKLVVGGAILAWAGRRRARVLDALAADGHPSGI